MNNISIFDVMYPKFTLKKPIRLIELFAGVGSQAMALRNIGMDFEHHRVVEFDKYAILSYNAIHGTDFPTHDITEFKGEDLGIEEVDKYDYIMTYSFPCQDLSVAGNMKGMSRDSGTRSGLLWEVERLLNETKELPQVLLMENVPQVIAEDNLEDFHEWVRFLEDKGYQNYVEKLNAKDYGVAQNRNRAFMVSILGDYSYNFPQKIKLEKTMKDYLEDEVDEKFYIDNEKASQLIEQLVDREVIGGDKTCVDGTINEPRKIEVMNCIKARYDAGISNFKSEGGMIVENIIIGGMQKNQAVKKDGISTTLTSAMGTGGGYVPMIVQDSIRLGGLYDEDDRKHQVGAVWDKDYLAPTIDTMQGGNRQPMILTPKRTEYGKEIRKSYEKGEVKESRHNMTQLEPRKDGICNTLTTVQKDNLVLEPTTKKEILGSIYTGASEKFQRGIMENTSRCLKAENHDTGIIERNTVAIKQATEQGYKIRKLNYSSKLYNLLFYIDGLCDIIGVMESDEYEKTKRNTNQTLQSLWHEVGKESLQWKARGLDSIQEKAVLQQRVYEGRNVECRGEREQCQQLKRNSEEDQRISNEKNEMRRMWDRWKTRYTPQGFRLSEQQYRELDSFMQKLSYEDTQNQRGMCNMWGSDESKRILRQTLSEIQEVWESLTQKEKSSLQGMWRTSERKTIMWETLSSLETEGNYRIRKLVPLECFRLMGFTDEDFSKAEKVNSNSQLYRQAGNSIVVQVLEAIFKQMEVTE